MTTMFTESYGNALKDLRDKVITHTEFLSEVGCDRQYRKWCEEHSIKPEEKNAELYFDMHGFGESEMVKEFIEPVSC